MSLRHKCGALRQLNRVPATGSSCVYCGKSWAPTAKGCRHRGRGIAWRYLGDCRPTPTYLPTYLHYARHGAVREDGTPVLSLSLFAGCKSGLNQRTRGGVEAWRRGEGGIRHHIPRLLLLDLSHPSSISLPSKVQTSVGKRPSILTASPSDHYFLQCCFRS